MCSNPENSYHYGVISRAIAHLDQADGANLTLEELSGKLQMSPSHFQRVFSKWAGVSPKKYQQYLVLGHAKSLLRSRFTVFDTAHSVGLSGSGRLHDLFLQWEAMTPGQYARSGEGLKINWGWFDSPFGELLAMGTDSGLCGLAFVADCGREAAFSDLASRWRLAEFVERTEAIEGWVRSALKQEGETRLFLLGTPFQIKVWEALLQIPSGHVSTYSGIARHIGHDSAVRATGTAVGRNPVSWLIPCHRIIQKSGRLGGYHWGLTVKRSLLAWESARFDSVAG